MTESTNNRMSRYEEKKDEQEELEEEVETESPKFFSSPSKKALLIIFLILLSLIIYSMTLATSFIDVKEYKVESDLLPDSFHGMKIVHFSDLHYGNTINQKQLERIVNKINKINPDVIFFTGDLVDKNIIVTDNIKSEIIKTLNKLNKDTYKYAIYGNEDKDTYKDIIEASGFTLLNNESKLFYYKDTTPVIITGFNTEDTNPNYTILTDYIDELDPTTLYKIVLTHEPDTIDNFINYNPNLVLSGHSLGGLIKIPFIKPLLLPDNSKKYYKDYYKLNGADFYISNGLGTSSIKARLNNHPSINFYRLYKTKEVPSE